MSFRLSKGPVATRLDIQEISEVVREVGESCSYMGFIRRSAIKQSRHIQMPTGQVSYGPFAPSADDDPFAAAQTTKPAFRVGWQWGGVVTNSWGMTATNNWSIIFEVFEGQKNQSVRALISGTASRKEVESFADHVFKRL